MQAQYALQVSPHIQVDEEGRRLRLSREVFGGLHPAMQRRFVLDAAQRRGAEPGFVHISAAVNLAATAGVGKIAQLTRGVRLRTGYGELIIEREDDPLPDDDYWLIEGQIPIAVPGETRCDGWLLLTSSIKAHIYARALAPHATQLDANRHDLAHECRGGKRNSSHRNILTRLVRARRDGKDWNFA